VHIEALPSATAALLDTASRSDEFSKFTLIGGTALALQVAHRISEDLDFVVHEKKLDRRLIRSLVEGLADGTDPRLVTSEAARQQCEQDGFDIDDFHQDWLVRGVKLTFFAPEADSEVAIYDQVGTHSHGSIRVLDKEGVYRLKCNVVHDRTTSRDLFDLWWFVTHDGKSVEDILGQAADRARHLSLDLKLAKISPVKFRDADPGFTPLVKDAPASKEELLKRMQKLVAAERARVAEAEVRKITKGPDHSAATVAAMQRARDQGRG
jgi:predicted nucleotidyltransferase component of viral defense system